MREKRTNEIFPRTASPKICYINVKVFLLLKIYLYFLFFLTILGGFDHRKRKCVHKTTRVFPKYIYIQKSYFVDEQAFPNALISSKSDLALLKYKQVILFT